MNDEINVVSTFFAASENNERVTIAEDFLFLIDELNEQLEDLVIPAAIKCVYNPTKYAREPFETYVKRYCNSKKRIVYFGMNPGPWGMSQTGVPFGEISSVRDWLGIEGVVGKPPQEIKSRPVKGFDCNRTEVSGKRFWGFFKDLCGEPQKFFETSFVYNYLPVQWMKSDGCNLTPGDFKATEIDPLYRICDPIFKKVLDLYDVHIIIAVGKFCELRAKKVLQRYSFQNNIQIIYMPHPSPRAVNNNNWNEKALNCLKENNLLHFYQKTC